MGDDGDVAVSQILPLRFQPLLKHQRLNAMQV